MDLHILGWKKPLKWITNVALGAIRVENTHEIVLCSLKTFFKFSQLLIYPYIIECTRIFMYSNKIKDVFFCFCFNHFKLPCNNNNLYSKSPCAIKKSNRLWLMLISDVSAEFERNIWWSSIVVGYEYCPLFSRVFYWRYRGLGCQT